ncbi:MAG: hypothetical protein Q9157_003725 [Trypethelium eluteriae]
MRPEDVLRRLDPLPVFSPAQWRPACVFLATPTFAKWTLDDDVFLRPALTRLFGESNQIISPHGPKRSIEVLVAVVDALRLNRPVTWSNTDRTHLPWNGSEGIAYILTDQRSIHFNQEDGAQRSLSERNLMFTFNVDRASTNEAKNNAENQSSDPSSTVIKFPLANTIFQTGYPATLHHSEWQLVAETPGWHRKAATKDLSSASLTWPSTALVHMQNVASKLSIELVPLTVPRQVEASMGNIVRHLSDGRATMPASHELEVSISEYFRARGISPHALSVWALVFSSNSLDFDSSDSAQDAIRENWSHKTPEISEVINSALTKGARLHKVLSGGGGWGKKVGLLSLDPGVGQAPASQLRDDDLIDSSVEEEALTEIAKPGAYIQFFVPPPASPREYKILHQKTPAREGLVESDLQQLSIGVVPSTIDEQTASQTISQVKTAEFTTSVGGCTVLTESALDLRFERATDLQRMIHTTKLDVPYALMTHPAYPTRR